MEGHEGVNKRETFSNAEVEAVVQLCLTQSDSLPPPGGPNITVVLT